MDRSLIFQNHRILRILPELAPADWISGCRGFFGPVPPPLWMSAGMFPVNQLPQILPHLVKITTIGLNLLHLAHSMQPVSKILPRSQRDRI
ncbi:hypothetical protein BECAL_01410 [Bellilinea caldifistulae]|nr:hypothetical protein BECAL_01410 [Bellilinea caldifistulae]